jgi:hypothetical protein
MSPPSYLCRHELATADVDRSRDGQLKSNLKIECSKSLHLESCMTASPETMRQVWITRHGPPEVREVREAGVPEPRDNEVLIKVAVIRLRTDYTVWARAADLKNLHWYFTIHDDQSLR